jgi:diguanylate cyclase (GGDEF)-like protein/PAS domain S-box-containing protein
MDLTQPAWPMALAVAGVLMLAVGLGFAWLGARRLRTARRAPAPPAASNEAAADTSLDPAQWTYQFLEQVLDRIQDGVIVCDAHGRVIEANEAAAKLLRRKVEDLAGADVHELAEPSVFNSHDALLAEGSTRLKTAGGEATAVAFTSCPLVDSGGHPRWALVFRNLSDQHRTQKRISYLARYDALTRVPNRMEFQHRLQQSIARARRTGTRAALLYVDMDGFKDINDRLGHPIGDHALEIVGRRLVESVDPGTLVGRLGGDEFGILIEGLAPDGDARPAVVTAARMLLDRLAQKIHVEGNELVLTASVGIALFPDDADDVIDIIRNADAAMYYAKQNGGNTYGFYSREMNADAVARLLLKSDLRSAIQRNEFKLLYQPKIDLRDGRISGCEALLRWHHTQRGDVPPLVFIPLAEENTLIFEIGEWVLDQVCNDYSEWQREVPWPGRVAVNLSVKQLRQRNFIAGIEEIFRRHELTPSCVELEITESTLIDHGEKTLRMLDGLYKLGLHLSIDDFGTGYSSLSSLQHFPIGTLKIDRSFVREANKERNSAAIVGAIVGLGRSLDMDVVAEGIETPEQLALLQRLDCAYGQGHLFGEPVSGARYLEMLIDQQQGKPTHAALFARA